MWDPGMTTSVLIKRSHLHSSHVHGDFLLQLTTHFTATLTGCKWPRRQRVWACLTAYFGAQPGTWVKLVSKNQEATTPEFVFVSSLSMQQASVAWGWSRGCRQRNHIPREIRHGLQHSWGVDTLKSWLCMTKARQPKIQRCFWSAGPQPPASVSVSTAER